MTRAGSTTSAVVLAAGTSSRMGTPKQLLRLDDRPLLQHVLDTLRASEVKEIIVVLGSLAELIRREVDLQGTRLVLNDNYHQGMGTSLKVGISAVASDSDSALIVLADQPVVRASTLNLLMAEHRRSRAEIVIPTYRGFRGNPVLLDRAVFAEVMQLSGDVGCRAVFGDHPQGIVKFPVNDMGILLDIDRKGDLEALHRASDRSGTEQTLMERTDFKDRRISASGSDRPELVIVGRDEMAIALAKLAKVLGFTITIVDPLLTIDELSDADRVLRDLNFAALGDKPDRHVVVASRGRCDEEAIEQALEARSDYVALVANRKRGEEVLRGLRRKGVPEEWLASVRVPAGVKIGAEGAEEIALSVLAEIVSLRNQRRKEPGTN